MRKLTPTLPTESEQYSQGNKKSSNDSDVVIKFYWKLCDSRTIWAVALNLQSECEIEIQQTEM